MELPELVVLSRQMEKELVGKRILDVEVSNPKCLNMPLKQFREDLVGKTIRSVECRGKWLFIWVEPDSTLLFNPGMGVDIIHFRLGEELPIKYRIKIALDDGTGFTVHVWWFCYLHLVPSDRISEHKLVGRLGLTPLDQGFSLGHFNKILGNSKTSIKSFLMDQKNVAGIGNVYIQDILFNAKLHPNRKVPTLTDADKEALYRSMRMVLNESIEQGGASYEKDFYGNKGGYGVERFKVAYKPGRPCPVCQTPIKKIRTGSTSSFICTHCQPLDT